jgi:hypothetical protein
VKLAQAKLRANQDVAGARAALMQVARSPLDVPYANRLGAAAAAAPSAERIWGSNELRLVGSGAAIPPTDANRPFFYEARLKAAAGSPEARLQLLRAALEDFPDRDAARLPMFRAAMAAKQDRLAITALGSRLSVLPGGSAYGGDEEMEARQAEYDVAANDYRMMKFTREERTAVAAEVATAYEHLDLLPDALRSLQVALRIETSADKKPGLERRIADLRARIRRREQNEARRPVIHPALEQDRVVRPMLLARTAPPAAPKARRMP